MSRRRHFRMLLRTAGCAPLMLSMLVASGQETSLRIPAGTPLPVQLDKHVPMKKGEPLRCRLLYPVYAENRLAIPVGSVVRGRVVGLQADHSRRVHSRLWGDFTPFHIPIVHFDELVLPDGTTQQFSSGSTADGAPVLHLSPPSHGKAGSLIAQQIDQAKERAKETVALVTAPGRGDRLVQFAYRQLPYHPERIETATTWTVTLARPLVMTAETAETKNGPRSDPPATARPEPATTHAKSADEKPEWHIHAYLTQTISSVNQKPGNTFEAVVSEPIFNADHTVAVPEGSVLVGAITQARPARSFGRAGKLRFDFRALKFPGAPSQHVTGTLSGADASREQQLELDQEGGVQSKPQNRVIVPLVLTLLAGRTLDDDSSVAGTAAVGSNGFGSIGRVVGMAAGSRGVAAAIGFYGAGLSFSERWLVHGQNIVFPKNTRIEVTTVPSPPPLSTGTMTEPANGP